MSKKVTKFPNKGKESNPENSREVVRRNELTGVIKQIIENVNEMAKHLMNDVNVLFKRFVYPVMMRTNAIENLLIKKEILTKDEINEEVKFLTEEAIKKAKEVDENGNPKPPASSSSEGVKAEENAKIEKIEEEEEVERVEAEIVGTVKTDKVETVVDIEPTETEVKE